jgi:hypothetical protein
VSPRLAIILKAHAIAAYPVWAAILFIEIVFRQESPWSLFFLITAPVCIPLGFGPTFSHRPISSLAGFSAYLLILILVDRALRRREIFRTRRHFKLCLACGYDLCATPDRCPECGMIPHGAS